MFGIINNSIPSTTRTFANVYYLCSHCCQVYCRCYIKKCLHVVIKTHTHTHTHTHLPFEAVMSSISLTQGRNMSEMLCQHTILLSQLCHGLDAFHYGCKHFSDRCLSLLLGHVPGNSRRKQQYRHKSNPIQTHHEQADSRAIHALITRGVPDTMLAPMLSATLLCMSLKSPAQVSMTILTKIVVYPYMIFFINIFALLLQ